MNEPLISVVLPVFNAGHFVIDAVASIIEQTLQDWELLCIDDGSTDECPAILDWFAAQDRRIRVIHQPNRGLVDALNVGCQHSRAPLIMRMDHDDIALPKRMQLQAAFMRDNPYCVVLGGGILEMDSDKSPLCISHCSRHHDQIVDDLLHRRTGHFHPTTLIRADALHAVGGYRSQYQWVEDHDLWLRLSERGELANISDVVLCYRQHAASICWQRSAQQRELMNQLLAEAYRRRGQATPPTVQLQGSARRSAAGPGKWARAASRGGYASSALKHLRLLNKSDARWSYKLRMNSEVALRLVVSLLARIASRSRQVGVPTFDHWHRRWTEAQFAATSSQAA